MYTRRSTCQGNLTRYRLDALIAWSADRAKALGDGCTAVTPVRTAFVTLPTKMRGELEGLQETGEGERAEKKEMSRLYNELLEQLKTAEEEKEGLQV